MTKLTEDELISILETNKWELRTRKLLHLGAMPGIESKDFAFGYCKGYWRMFFIADPSTLVLAGRVPQLVADLANEIWTSLYTRWLIRKEAEIIRNRV